MTRIGSASLALDLVVRHPRVMDQRTFFPDLSKQAPFFVISRLKFDHSRRLHSFSFIRCRPRPARFLMSRMLTLDKSQDILLNQK